MLVEKNHKKNIKKEEVFIDWETFKDFTPI
jgi:hypothetical protein